MGFFLNLTLNDLMTLDLHPNPNPLPKKHTADRPFEIDSVCECEHNNTRFPRYATVSLRGVSYRACSDHGSVFSVVVPLVGGWVGLDGCRAVFPVSVVVSGGCAGGSVPLGGCARAVLVLGGVSLGRRFRGRARCVAPRASANVASAA